jgi:OOP family OmpA-OmpF porin
MHKKMKLPGSLLSVSAIALAAAATGAFAQAPASQSGYLTWGGTTNAVRAGVAGVCVRTNFWSPAMATEQCDPDLVPRQAPPAAPVAPRAAPPAPAPAPVAPPAPPKPEPKPAPVAPTIEKVTLQTDALFDFDKSVIRPDAQTKLDDLVSKIKGVNLEVVIAVGHTDRLGSVAYNQRLSVRRAEAVKNYLVSKGVPANRIYTEGKGKSQPVKDCTDKNRKALIACLQPNRRVDVEIVGTRQR